MSDSEEECKLREDLWSGFCSVSRFQISGLLIRQASSSAVPAVRQGLACFFDWPSPEGGCKGAHGTDTLAHTFPHCARTHSGGTCTSPQALLHSAAPGAGYILVPGPRKAERKQGWVAGDCLPARKGKLKKSTT